MDITQLILDDHHEQRRLFAILEQIDRADTGTLSAVWERLASFLELHAAAEEEIFYPGLLRVGVGAGRAGSVALAVLAVVRGARIIRAHDVEATVDALAAVAAVELGADTQGTEAQEIGT